MRIQPVDDAIADSLGLGTARGALVAGVDDKGPAKPAGLMPGDVIVKFDGKDIKESRDLPRLVASMPVGQQVDVVVVRKGQEITKTVTLGRLEDGEKVAAASAEATDDGAGKSATLTALGLELAPIDDAARKSFKLKDSVKGAVIASRRARLDGERQGPAPRRSDRGSEPAGGRDAIRRRHRSASTFCSRSSRMIRFTRARSCSPVSPSFA